MQFNVKEEARQKRTCKGMQQLAEFYKARQRALMNAHLAKWNTHQRDKYGQPRPPVDDETTYTVDEEINKNIDPSRSKERSRTNSP